MAQHQNVLVSICLQKHLVKTELECENAKYVVPENSKVVEVFAKFRDIFTKFLTFAKSHKF